MQAAKGSGGGLFRAIAFSGTIALVACSQPASVPSMPSTGNPPGPAPGPLQQVPAQTTSQPLGTEVPNAPTTPVPQLSEASASPRVSVRPASVPLFPSASQYPASSVFDWDQFWKGPIQTTGVVSLGNAVYAAAGAIQSAPAASGDWTPLSLPSGTWSQLASDGRSLYAGNQGGQIVQIDPVSDQVQSLGQVSGPITALQWQGNALWVGTDGAGCFRMDVTGVMTPLPGAPAQVRSLALAGDRLLALADGIREMPAAGGSWSRLSGTASASVMATSGNTLYVGMTDGSIWGGLPSGPLFPMVRPTHLPITVMAVDRWDMYAGTGNTLYMIDFTGRWWAPCGSALPGPLTFVQIMNLDLEIVGTQDSGLFSMPR